ncbi:MAG: biosynthetic arginine decarboxylase [Acidobacteriota bacterium]|nr:biosynthetic arginine decarboxylase [Blastocatellia bacterium]MDW8412234.1 biosynthetic arginine decarboxylase [Acidobacteriota bacterium]
MKNILEETIQTYGIENWGAGFFDVNKKGNLVVRPGEGEAAEADIFEIVNDLLKRGVKLPVILRFPQILSYQVRKLYNSYQTAMREYDYKGAHRAVFPMKVNPRRDVLEEVLREGRRYNFGIECGSKPELFAALALEQAPQSLIVCNGFKDEAYIRLAFIARQIGKRLIIVIEKVEELHIVLRQVQQTGVKPELGIRARLYSRGSGRWEKSGGETAKFGLTTSEMLEVVRVLRQHNMLDCLKMLHFHIGSQITDIKRIKNAMKEAARVYCKMRQMRVDIEFLNVGGGMGVDYDGSKTSFDSSANYTMQEFANDVVYTIKSVCDEEDVPEPTIVTESGRILAAFHAMIVTNIQDEIETVLDDISAVTTNEDDPQVVIELKDLVENINSKNYREYYHDALEHKEELFTLFNLGLINLEDRAKGEALFWEVCERASKFSQQSKIVTEEFDELKKLLSAKYLCNFSVFRCLPDNWAIEQLFPIMPIHKLNTTPSEHATLVDLTCDSDGIIEKFIDLKDVKETLELHHFKPGEPYYLGFFMIGAYQEVMGNFHNLFGTLNEAHVIINKNGYLIKKILPGSHISDVLMMARYDKNFLLENFNMHLEEQVKQGNLDAAAAEELRTEYMKHYEGYTYLG